MAAICESCGKVNELLSCNICGSRICRKCKLRVGCKICGGVKMFET